MIVLEVCNLGKAYRQYSSQWHRVFSWFGLPVKPVEEHWVLRNVSFSVAPGEAVGVIGQNGAGKSTLLKLITGTQRPTEGHIRINGRVAAILELGMGFNPEFTGRQNAFHGLGLMGLSQRDIEKVMPKLEAFAEIDEYFNQPVRIYSSGMQMRVAFAVATAFRPEILIIDEALSVGVSYFQHKSMAKIREFKEQGTTLFFVSHDPGAVKSLCDRAILLEEGVLIKEGSPESVMDFYNALIAEKEESTLKVSEHYSGRVQTVSGTGEAQVIHIELQDTNEAPIEFVKVGQDVELYIKVQANVDIPQLVLGYMIKDRLGQEIFGTNTFYTEQIIKNIKAGEIIDYRIKFRANIGPGNYSISTALVSTDTHLVNNYEWKDLALVFSVGNQEHSEFIGCNWIPPVFEVIRL